MISRATREDSTASFSACLSHSLEKCKESYLPCIGVKMAFSEQTKKKTSRDVSDMKVRLFVTATMLEM